jgi:hypothetical protein
MNLSAGVNGRDRSRWAGRNERNSPSGGHRRGKYSLPRSRRISVLQALGRRGDGLRAGMEQALRAGRAPLRPGE